MNDMYNAKLVGFSRNLRNSMTKEEKHLWYDFLKSLPINVYRQKVFGNYIADFYIPSAKIAVELDGSQHYEENVIENDKQRDAFFAEKGVKVLRYSNREINENFRNVCEDIYYHIFG